MLAARGQVVIFADADLSWSVADLSRFMTLVEATQTPVVIGSREGFGAQARRRAVRTDTSWAASSIAWSRRWPCPVSRIRSVASRPSAAEAARAIFERQRIDGFGFDVEILYLARRLGYPIRVEPLRWEHKENSRVVPVRDTLLMLSDVLRVRLNAARGRYA